MGPRVQPDGKFLRSGADRFRLKGVTYGTFAPDATGYQFPTLELMRRDFALMASHGINTVRTYTPPDERFLDAAGEQGLRVMVGLPWSQHVAFLDDRELCRSIRAMMQAEILRLSSHPAVLMVALGNEIPAAIVRWHGHARIEQFLLSLYDAGKAAAPETLLTYVNFPPTQHLDLSFLDVLAYNVYLHRESDLRAYIAQLQNQAGAKPLLLAELGADSFRQGEDGQALLTATQLRAAFQEGACGAIAFAWTDEWWRGGFTVEDWAFGLVDTERRPKAALAAVTKVFADAPFSAEEQADWPSVSVVVCAYNAADTLEECLVSLEHLTYPKVEIILVNDGSRDATSQMGPAHPRVRVIDVPNGGLSAARNLGMTHATGDIVAYTDADVRVDPDWLTFLVQPFIRTDAAASGGPNIVPPDDPWKAQCVARAPGGPTHVLLDNTSAEHVPGCNMAFRRSVLLALGGFNPLYLRAGDDVDLCWRVLGRGWKIGFAPAALVWHRHRATVKAYWRQQVGYGEGEQWLIPHHPDRFHRGQAHWRGHIYSPLPFVQGLRRRLINTGTWGTSAFPSVYSEDGYHFAYMPHKVRWFVSAAVLLVSGTGAAIAAREEIAGLLLTLGVLAVGATAWRCVSYARQSDLRGLPPIGARSAAASRLLYRAMIAWLHVVQPFARALGRLRGMRTVDIESTAPEGAPSAADLVSAVRLLVGLPVEVRYWNEEWVEQDQFLTAVHQRLQASRGARGVEVDDGWQQARDLSVQVGRWSAVDLRTVMEDHGSGKRLARVALGVRFTPIAKLVCLVLVLLALAGLGVHVPGLRVPATNLVWPAAGALAGLLAIRLGRAIAATRESLNQVARTFNMTLVPTRVDESRRPAALQPVTDKSRR